MTTLSIERLNRITDLHKGSHPENETEMCVMEAVAWISGEPWSDHPKCTCPILGEFMRVWNDALPTNEDRTRLLRPLIPRLVNTKGSPALESRRAILAADWLIRVYTPAWLRRAKLDAQAETLASQPEIAHFAQCWSLVPVLTAVRDDAFAARSAVGAVAKDAAEVAIGAAAGYAAGDIAGAVARTVAEVVARAAAEAAAEIAARDAARDAARAAAGDAAWDALKPTTAALQQSALELVDRMIAANAAE